MEEQVRQLDVKPSSSGAIVRTLGGPATDRHDGRRSGGRGDDLAAIRALHACVPDLRGRPLPRGAEHGIPFANARCKQVDLGQWLDEKYRVPSSESALDEGGMGASGQTSP